MKPNIVRGTALKILGIVMRPGLRPTVRDILKETGHQSINGVHGHLRRLERLGLITHDLGKAATLRATVKFVPAEELP